MKKSMFIPLLGLGLLLTSCMSDSQLKSKMKEIIKKNPDIVTESIEENPVAFVEAFQKAVRKGQQEMARKREEDKKQELTKRFDKPLTPSIGKEDAIRGVKGAPIVLIEYSDFECPFCTRGFQTVNDLMDRYKGKVQFIYKHLPLEFHKSAMIAAQYYEAIRIQSAQKAFKFHDAVFAGQRKLSQQKEKFLKKTAKAVGANMGRLKKDLNSKRVTSKIAADMAEAKKFGFSGTPGFLINGVPVEGAYPVDHFEMILTELKKRGKLKL